MNKVNSYFIELSKKLDNVLKKESTLSNILFALEKGTITLHEKFDYTDAYKKLDEFKDVLNKVASIVYSPHINISTNEIIVRSEIAGNITRESFLDTTRDTKLWKKKKGEFAPQYVHTKENIDTLDCYENRFICLLIDEINNEFEVIKDSLSFVNDSLEEHFELKGITFNEFGIFNAFKDYSYPYEGIFLKPSTYLETIFKLIEVLSRRIKNIKGSLFYKTCSGKLKDHNIMPTNILIHDGLYNYCYRYFKNNYLFKESNSLLMEVSSYNYFLLTLFDYFRANKIGKGSKNVTSYYHLDDFGRLRIPTIEYKKNDFAFKIQEDSARNGLIVEVKYVGKNGTIRSKVSPNQVARFYLLNSYSFNEDSYNHLNPTLIRLAKDYDNVIIVTMVNQLHSYNNVFTLSLFKENHETLFKNLFASFTMLFLSSADQYKHKCPVCGNKNVYEVSNHFECEDCNASYSFLKRDDEDVLWIKSLRRKY